MFYERTNIALDSPIAPLQCAHYFSTLIPLYRNSTSDGLMLELSRLIRLLVFTLLLSLQ